MVQHLDVQNHGSIFILTPLTPEAIEWFEQHMPDDVQMWGPNGYVVEPRYVQDILEGIAGDLG